MFLRRLTFNSNISKRGFCRKPVTNKQILGNYYKKDSNDNILRYTIKVNDETFNKISNDTELVSIQKLIDKDNKFDIILVKSDYKIESDNKIEDNNLDVIQYINLFVIGIAMGIVVTEFLIHF